MLFGSSLKNNFSSNLFIVPVDNMHVYNDIPFQALGSTAEYDTRRAEACACSVSSCTHSTSCKLVSGASVS